MADFDITEGIKKAFLAGVGAVALGAEKTQEVVNDLIEKGQLTVDQGKAMNEELTRKAKEVMDSTSDAALKAKLKSMTAEERAAWAEKVAQMASDIDAETVEVDVEVEDADEHECGCCCKDADEPKGSEDAAE